MINHHHGHAPDGTHRHNANKKVLRLALILIASFMLVEALAGWLTSSLALLSDAGHMFSDAAALALSLAAFHLGERPADSRRSFGYQRFEIIAAAINGATLIVIALWIIIEAVLRLIHPPAVAGPAMLAVALLGLGINLIVARLMLRGGDTRDNLNMHSAYLHVLGDLLGSVGAILAALLITAFGWQWADPLASLAIAVLIGKSGLHTCRDSLHILMEGAPAGVSLADISTRIRAVDGVQGIHDIHAWTITSASHALSCHIVVDPGLTVGQAFAITRAVEKTVQRHGIAHVTVQIEPPEHGHSEQRCHTRPDCGQEHARPGHPPDGEPRHPRQTQPETTMQLYLSPTSPYGRLVLVGALNAGIRNLQLNFVDPWGNPPELQDKNPFSQIPTLVTDGGHILYDSFIIADYLLDHPVRGGHQAAILAFARILIDQSVKCFALNRHQPPGTPHPHIERARQAIIRALSKAPQLDAGSREFAHLALGVALSYLQLRLPEIFAQHVSAANRQALEQFAQRDIIRLTRPEALEKRPKDIDTLRQSGV